VDPNGSATTYHFEYGTTTAYGLTTPEGDAGDQDAAVPAEAQVSNLTPGTTYHFRVVATNEAGIGRSMDRVFRTDRLPTGVTLALDEPRTPYGEGIEVFGTVSGVGVNGIPVAIERQDFPYTGPFTSTGMPLPRRATRDGGFRIFVPQLFQATRLRAVTRTHVVAISPTVTANVAVKVGLTARKVSHGRKVRLRGSIRPTTPNGRAVLQRRKAHGGWTFVRSKSAYRRYTFVVKRRTKVRIYRVRVIARDGGAHVPGTSRKVKVKRRG
jgi:ribosomal protein L34